LQIHNHLTLVDAQILKLTREKTAGVARRLGVKQVLNDSIQHIHALTDG
jgi:hypothetical protein